VISNTSVMLKAPMRFNRTDGDHSAVEQSILHHLGVDRLEFVATGSREKLSSERSRRWAAERQARDRQIAEPG
jgi:hypothetical protein